MQWLYNLVLWCYGKAIALAAHTGNAKAAQWVAGRKAQQNVWKQTPAEESHLWVHCASLGEFEQGRPVLEQLRQQYPQKKILLTFFSPSGYEVRKAYPHSDTILYLPLDSKHHAQQLIKRFNIELAIFVKYEYWYYYLTTLRQQNIPTVLVSGIFRERHWIFRSFFKPALQAFTHFFVQDDASGQLLTAHGYSNHTLAGDTRFDRVAEQAKQPTKFPLIEKWAGKSRVVVAGSTWPADETMLIDYMRKTEEDAKLIIAPHETSPQRIAQLQQQTGNLSVLNSELSETHIPDSRILIVDSVGMLASLYAMAHVAYVGGGFGAGVHNTLEAAVYGVPVIVGPRYEKFKEIKELIKLGGIFTVGGYTGLAMRLDSMLLDDAAHQQAGNACAQYCREHRGATGTIMQYLATLLA